MLTDREKELASFGASVAAGCKPCTRFHIKKVRESGTPESDIEAAITTAVAVRGHARDITESQALRLVGVSKPVIQPDPIEDATRVGELVSIASAFAVNCTSSLEQHIETARGIGVPDQDIRTVIDAALTVKEQAASYVDRVGQLKEKVSRLQQLLKDLEETQAQLVQSEKMAALGRLVAGIVHEINTPMGAIQSSSDTTGRAASNLLALVETSASLEDVKGDERFRRAMQALESDSEVTKVAAARIADIIGRLKSFARLDEAEFQRVDLHEGLDAALSLLEPDLDGTVTVVKEYGNLPAVECYPAEVNQVFMNILMNAIQAIEGQGTIAVRTLLDGESVHIEISDTGVGIPPDQLSSLFEPGITKRGARMKAGLGLFTSFSIVQKHRGDIRVKSIPGEGSTFTVTLPVA